MELLETVPPQVKKELPIPVVEVVVDLRVMLTAAKTENSKEPTAVMAVLV
jgi:uncharacterized membrane protein YhhN